jgi:hypothetical protein
MAFFVGLLSPAVICIQKRAQKKAAFSAASIEMLFFYSGVLSNVNGYSNGSL